MTPEELAKLQRAFLIGTEKQSAILLDAQLENVKRRMSGVLLRKNLSKEVADSLDNFLKEFLASLDASLDTFSVSAARIVERSQKGVINSASRILKEFLPKIKSSIFDPDKEAIQNLIGRTQNGKSLVKFFQRFKPVVAENAKAALIEGFTVGESSQVIARRLEAVTGAEKYRVLTIARTETNESFRAANRNFLHSAGIKKYIWKSIRDNRTCLICWSLHNKLFPTNKKVFSHPNCRCVLVGFQGEKLESSETSFAKLERGFQKEILGKQRFEMYQSGKISLNDFVGKIDTEEFGERHFIKPISNLFEQG